MDLRIFYQKLRQIEAGIAEDPTLVVSLETSDGGKSGVFAEVRREVAARLLVEGRARLAVEDEASDYRASTAKARQLLEEDASARRVQVAVISEGQLRAMRDKGRQKV